LHGEAVSEDYVINPIKNNSEVKIHFDTYLFSHQSIKVIATDINVKRAFKKVSNFSEPSLQLFESIFAMTGGDSAKTIQLSAAQLSRILWPDLDPDIGKQKIWRWIKFIREDQKESGCHILEITNMGEFYIFRVDSRIVYFFWEMQVEVEKIDLLATSDNIKIQTGLLTIIRGLYESKGYKKVPLGAHRKKPKINSHPENHIPCSCNCAACDFCVNRNIAEVPADILRSLPNDSFSDLMDEFSDLAYRLLIHLKPKDLTIAENRAKNAVDILFQHVEESINAAKKQNGSPKIKLNGHQPK
jgi:hypothetical protein